MKNKTVLHIMKLFFKVTFIIILFNNFLYASTQKPYWIENRPISNDFYLGIGVSQKEKDNRDYIQKAKDHALKDLSSEITVNIKSEIINEVIEKSGILEEEFKSQIRSSTQAELEGFELVDTYEDKNEYWVYYKLSKRLYKEQKQKKLQKAVTLSLDLFSKARENENEKNIEKALLFYLQSLNPINKYIGEPLEVVYKGKKVFLSNEIYSSIQHLLSKIDLRAKIEEHEGKIGRALNRPLEVLAIYSNEIKIINLPLKFSFIKGSGDMISEVRTGLDGIGKCNINKISSKDKIQLIKAELDIYKFVNQDSTSLLFQNIINNFPVPYTKLILNVSGLSIFVESNELNLSKGMETSYIEPKLKKTLSEKGFIFVDDLTNADIVINLVANSRKGSEVYGLYTSFVDATVSIIDLSLGNEIYKNSFPNVNGGGLDYEKAGLKAFENAATKISEEVLAELIKKIE